MMEKAKDKAAETTEKHTGFNALVSGLGIAPVSAFYIVCNTLSTYNSPGKTPLCHRSFAAAAYRTKNRAESCTASALSPSLTF
ncbi:MAG: hypothetical protein ACLR09_06275 [Gallintestinimicrobium sp.]